MVMPIKKKTEKKFVSMSKYDLKTYRITFTCCEEGLNAIRDEIIGYGTIEEEEVEVDV